MSHWHNRVRSVLGTGDAGTLIAGGVRTLHLEDTPRPLFSKSKYLCRHGRKAVRKQIPIDLASGSVPQVERNLRICHVWVGNAHLAVRDQVLAFVNARFVPHLVGGSGEQRRDSTLIR